MSFVNAHFVTYARDLGYHPMVAAAAFSMIGFFAITGALLLGHLSDKHGRRGMLTLSYNLRAVGFVVVLLSMGVPFLGIPVLGIGPLLLGVIFVGFSWNAVVSITAAYASDRFGITNLGTIYGMMFAVMPLGYDARGTYDIAIWSNIALLLLATGVSFSINERRSPRENIAVAH